MTYSDGGRGTRAHVRDCHQDVKAQTLGRRHLSSRPSSHPRAERMPLILVWTTRKTWPAPSHQSLAGHWAGYEGTVARSGAPCCHFCGTVTTALVVLRFQCLYIRVLPGVRLKRKVSQPAMAPAAVVVATETAWPAPVADSAAALTKLTPAAIMLTVRLTQCPVPVGIGDTVTFHQPINCFSP